MSHSLFVSKLSRNCFSNRFSLSVAIGVLETKASAHDNEGPAASVRLAKEQDRDPINLISKTSKRDSSGFKQETGIADNAVEILITRRYTRR